MEEIQKQVNKLEEESVPIAKKINEYHKKCFKAIQNDDVEALSKYVVEIAALNSQLGHKMAEAGWLARKADRAYRKFREKIKVDYVDNHKKAIGYADSQKYIDSFNEHEIYNKAAYMEEDLKSLRHSTEDLIDTIRSRIGVIRSDIKNG